MKHLFKSVGCDGITKQLNSIELDEIHALLNDRILYCENPKDTPILSRVFKNGVELYSDSPDYDTEKLMLS